MKHLVLGKAITKQNCLIAFVLLFLMMAILIGIQPYDPMKDDIADATTNAIWTEQYSKGIYEIPFQNWTYGMTQSVVVWHNGQYVVVNEKGPGLAFMLVPFHVLGIEFMFGPFMVALAVFSTYMLGKRLSNWRVGFIAAIIVLLNLTVIIMWFRYYWVDAATMHLLIVSIWLLVEANYWFNGKTLDPKASGDITLKNMMLGIGFALLSGLVFGASVSTRYPVSLIIIAMFLYMLIFYVLRAWSELRKRNLLNTTKKASGLVLLLIFIVGLLFILIPLTHYNSEYFGGPFKSGYDATALNTFTKSDTIAPRNGSTTWLNNLGTGVVNAWNHLLFPLTPTVLFRMPALIIAPLGLWLIRKNKPIIILLVLWIIIGLFTYMSLSVVTMYSGWDFILTRAHEPRYFMPIVPAGAILGALGINYVAFERKQSRRSSDEKASRRAFQLPTVNNSSDKKKLTGTLLVGSILFLAAIPGVYPAIIHFSNPDLVFPPNMAQHEQGGLPSNGQQKNQQPPPSGLPIQNITTDQLLSNPEQYAGRLIQIKNAVVSQVMNDGVAIKSMNALNTGDVPMRFVGWPNAEKPTMNILETINVRGSFVKEQNANSYEIIVQWGTQDYLRRST
jgi:hypothetical protein